MELKIHDSGQSIELALPTDRKQCADRLIAKLIAAVKQNDNLDESKIETGKAVAAAIKLKDEAKPNRPRSGKLKLRDLEQGKDLLLADPATQKEAIFFSEIHLAKNRHLDFVTDIVCEALLSSLLRKKLNILTTTLPGCWLRSPVTPTYVVTSLSRKSLAMSSVTSSKRGFTNRSRNTFQKMTGQFHSGASHSDARKIGQRVEALLTHPAPSKPKRPGTPTVGRAAGKNKKPASLSLDLNTGEVWTTTLLETLDQTSDETRSRWFELLEHCGSAKSSKPTKKFLKRSANALMHSLRKRLSTSSRLCSWPSGNLASPNNSTSVVI